MNKNFFAQRVYYGWVVVGLALVSMSYWFGLRTTFSTFTLGRACFSLGIFFLLLYQYEPSVLLLFLFALRFGAGWGSTAPMFMSIAGDLYKGKHFGLIYGMVEGGIGVGAAAGSWIADYIFDQSQNYLWAFILAILFNIFSIFLVWYIAPGRTYRVTGCSPGYASFFAILLPPVLKFNCLRSSLC